MSLLYVVLINKKKNRLSAGTVMRNSLLEINIKLAINSKYKLGLISRRRYRNNDVNYNTNYKLGSFMRWRSRNNNDVNFYSKVTVEAA